MLASIEHAYYGYYVDDDEPAPSGA